MAVWVLLWREGQLGLGGGRKAVKGSWPLKKQSVFSHHAKIHKQWAVVNKKKGFRLKQMNLILSLEGMEGITTHSSLLIFPPVALIMG